MLALIAGQGDLPRAVIEALPEPALVCGMESSPPDRVAADHLFRIEKLGTFLRWLKAQGVTRVCMCGAVGRPEIRASRLDVPTLLLLPKILRALKRGDDGALRIVIGLLEDAGLEVVGAHEAAPALLPETGVLTQARPGTEAAQMATLADAVSHRQGLEDLGQCCVISGDQVVAQEDARGTDAMLGALPPVPGGLFYKAPKPGQERRADLPVIGPNTAVGAIRAGLAGIVIEAQGVMVLDRAAVIEMLDAAGLFLWVRERDA
ncbi:UDP-2,3-diacylglucosamine diphosphatase LpxI [Yangia mangrovi]|uniref:Phosphatidate cytidylyltransferase n=1 Tax=Alloyangia mangrovi TaxID=1779329 RepID=A0A2A3JWZ3_9RHOB|nr:UDP-2,3-diacylglucosamine diphosphatase LpxI [Alloyangia mangrovi]MCT4369368.1 UDP-2,3-diacylglucosamine diphosphatase LpxI [Alloyangia mangrovi]